MRIQKLFLFFLLTFFLFNISFAGLNPYEQRVKIKFKFEGYKNESIDFENNKVFVRIYDTNKENLAFADYKSDKTIEAEVPIFANYTVMYGISGNDGGEYSLKKSILVKRHNQEFNLKIPPSYKVRHRVTIKSEEYVSCFELRYKNLDTDEMYGYSTCDEEIKIPIGKYNLDVVTQGKVVASKTVYLFRDTTTSLYANLPKSIRDQTRGRATINFIFTKPLPEGTVITVEKL